MQVSPEQNLSVIPVAYARRLAKAPSAYHPLPAILLCTPGLLCWVIFLGAFGGLIPSRILDRIVGPWILFLIGVAVLTALPSLPIYLWRPLRLKPWYVYFNLLINISGLIFVTCLFRPW